MNLHGDSYRDFSQLMKSETPDLYYDVSDCCGAPVIDGDICHNCYEHCTPEENEYSKKVSHEMEMGVDYV